MANNLPAAQLENLPKAAVKATVCTLRELYELGRPADDDALDEMAAPEPPEAAAEVLNGISRYFIRQTAREPHRGQKKAVTVLWLPLVGLFFGWSFSE